MKYSYHVDFGRIPRQSKFARFSRKQASSGTLGVFLSGTQGATCQAPVQSSRAQGGTHVDTWHDAIGLKS